MSSRKLQDNSGYQCVNGIRWTSGTTSCSPTANAMATSGTVSRLASIWRSGVSERNTPARRADRRCTEGTGYRGGTVGIEPGGAMGLYANGSGQWAHLAAVSLDLLERWTVPSVDGAHGAHEPASRSGFLWPHADIVIHGAIPISVSTGPWTACAGRQPGPHCLTQWPADSSARIAFSTCSCFTNT